MNIETDNSKHESSASEKSWFEQNVNLLIAELVIACALTLIAQAMFQFHMLGLHPIFSEEHPAHFELESMYGFQALFGFVVFICVVFLGRMLRPIIMRKEDYYDS